MNHKWGKELLKNLFSAQTYKALYLKVRSRGLLATIAIASALVLVLSSGVGATLAATGVISLPTATQTPTATPSSTPTSTVAPKKEQTAQAPPGNGVEPPNQLFNGGAIDSQGMLRAGASGWTGVRVYFENQMVGAVIGGRPTQSNDTIQGSWTFDGRTSSFSGACARDTSGTCIMYFGFGNIGYAPHWNNGRCLEGSEYTIRVWGSGLNVTQTGRVPAGASNCPPPPAPVTVPAPSAPEPVPPAPEPAPPAPEPSPSQEEPSSSPTPAG